MVTEISDKQIYRQWHERIEDLEEKLIYVFIRKVYEHPQTKRAHIDILKEHILLPKAFINMFVLAEWNLNSEQLTIHYENNLKTIAIKMLSFALNPVSKHKVY